MPAQYQTRPARADTEVLRIPNLSDFLALASVGDGAVWAAFADHTANARRPLREAEG
jgi:hypothetical protein